MGESEIRNVWKHNLEEEINALSNALKTYTYVSMDTEFPGVIAKPVGSFSCTSLYTYNQLRCNISLLGLIQLGVSLSDEKGDRPTPSTWQFNFYFNRDQNMSAQESMHILEQAEIDFDKLKKDGIPIEVFADFFTTSGLLMNADLTWISFHSSYDFGYLISAISGKDLPNTPDEFFSLLVKIFPSFYDIKYLINALGIKGGLQDLAADLKIERTGVQHQAGSDALLTLQVFHAFKKQIAPDVESNQKYRCRLFGIEAN
ncbi:CCR4-NOT transcription complex subunit 7/8 [Nematocida homosporus]|uniref:CCR4-NOT transcription complex subunit 7/8 n=1 Tax=Nematocida homosporus TaxID=1912981 RepID=UPI00221EC232|nr:CCR4-NOT transcription complex subunit 7/8 [Nematocida homosporus]KAI5184599.1 CCR4-NOT transcription complex subunit 7/8 [Nematocida homosporus]